MNASRRARIRGGRSGRSGIRLSSVLLITLMIATTLAVLPPVLTRVFAAVTTTAADNLRTGWYPDQPTLDPSTVAGSSFGQLYSLDVQGTVYAQPLVSNNVLLVATEHNLVYGFNPSTRERLWIRDLGTPAATLPGCNDILTEIGVTSTPVVDPATNTMYVMSSSVPAGRTDPTDAVFDLHAMDVTTGVERPNFPVRIQGRADNDPSLTFNGKYELQRPGLLLMGGVVYAGFSGHCDRKPFQGWIAGVSTSTATMTALWSDMVSPGAVADDGPGGGIWMSGSGLVSDAPGDIVFTTGNGTPPPTGPGSENTGALAQAQVRVRVQPDGKLQHVDHFAPYDASVLNETDSDVGSGGVVALPPQYFGTPEYPRLMVSVGKQGYIWLTDATDMGGVGQGPLGSDDVVSRTGPLNGGVRGKPAVWGGEGGYVYIATSQAGSGTGRLQAYKYLLDGNGKPSLALAGQSTDLFGFGSGSPVITSDGTGSGSALLWTTWFPPSAADPQHPGVGAQLRAYDAVPVNGQLVLRRSFPLAEGTKFAVPGVSDGRLYIGTFDGKVLAFGSPIQAPLRGSTLSFPRTTVGSTSTATARVTADSAVTVQSVASNNPRFSVVSTSPALPAALPPGGTVDVTLRFTPGTAGGDAAALTFETSGGPWAMSLSGTGQSAGPQLVQFPCCLSYGGVVAGSSKIETVTFSNQGAAPLVIDGYDLPSAPFTVSGLPPAGTSIPSGQTFAATFTFAPTDLGLFTDALILHTNDPKAVGFDGPGETIAAGAVALSGTGGSQPVMRITPSDINYGDVPIGTTATQTFAVTNTGGTDLNITISKPPSGHGFEPRTYLPESYLIKAGETATQRVDFTPTAAGPASDTWAITGDDGAGRQTVTLRGVGVAPSAPTVSIGDLDLDRPTTGTTTASVRVTLSRASATPVSMTYTSKDGTATSAGGDYTPVSGTLTFAPGETTKIIPITVNGAQPQPVAETLTVNLGGYNGVTAADASAKVYLTSTYLPVSIYVDDAVAPADPAGSALTFPVTVRPTPTPGQPVTVKVATADGTAVAGSGDYTPVSTSLTFTDQTPTQTVTVPLLNPPAAGGSRTVSLLLSNPSAGSNIADGTALGTVYTGSTPPLPSLYVSDAAIVRSTTQTVGATFTVRLSRPSTTAQVPVTYTAGAGSGMTAADFEFTQNNFTFQPGETVKTVTVPVRPSATSTGTGNVNLNLSKQSGASLGDPGGKAYVVSPVVHSFVSVRPASAWRSPSEDTTVQVPVTLDGASRVPVTVAAATADGTGVAGTDYAATSTTLTIAPGQTTAFVPVTVLHQAAVQPAKTFQVKLSGATGVAQLSSSTATVTIVGHSADVTVPTGQFAPSFTAATPPGSAMVGAAYDYTFAAAGTPEPSFALASGKLPPGLTLNARTGRLSGTTVTAGSFTFTITANNTVGAPATTGALTVVVVGPQIAPTFSSATPPSTAVENSSYLYTFAADGNPAPQYGLASGSLPPGLALDPVTGTLAGAPGTPGRYTFTVSATNGVGTPAVTGPLTIQVTAAPVAPQLTAASPNTAATVGATYDYSFAASGNPSPVFTVSSGALPPGVVLDRVSGRLSGSPTTAGAYTFQVSAGNGVGSPAVSAPITITVSAAPTVPSFTAAAPDPDATVGTAYRYTFTADGSPSPVFAVATGALPPGLTLAATGAVSGTPTSVGTHTFSVSAENSRGRAVTGALTITVRPRPEPPAWTASTPPTSAAVGAAVSYRYAATGVPAPGYSLTADSELPAGLSLNPVSGELSGSPSSAGSFTFTVRAANGVSPDATATSTMVISAAPSPPVFTAAGPPARGTSGQLYSYAFAASGVPAPEFTVASGTIPDGLTLGVDGVLTGRLSTAATFTFSVRAANASGSVTTPPVTIIVDPAPAAPVFSASAPTIKGMVAVPYSYRFAASGVPAPTFAVVFGALPPGLTLDPTSGSLSGTPTTAGPFTFAVQASNGVAPAPVTKSLTITVSPAGPADLAVSISGPTTIRAGATGTYNLNITNTGPGTAVQISGRLTIPAGMTVISSSPAATVVDGVATWTQPTLSTGSAIHWKLTVRPNSPGTFVLQGAASAASDDPVPGNDTATFSTTGN